FRSTFGARWYNEWIWAGAYVTGPTSGAIHSGSSNPPDGTTEQLGGFARVALQLVHEKDYSFHIGGDVEALFKPALDRITNARRLTLRARPELRIDPTVTATTGGIQNTRAAQVYSVEAAATWGPLFFQGEYFWFNVDRNALATPGTVTGPSLKFSGGYAE